MVIESFLDSTVELFQVESDASTKTSWGFRVLTLQPEKTPALYESPERYQDYALALTSAKLHALKAKVENTEDVPCCATRWDTDLVYVQNDLAIATFGNAVNQNAGRYYLGGGRSRLRQQLKNSSTGHIQSLVVFTHAGETWVREIALQLISIGDWLFTLEKYAQPDDLLFSGLDQSGGTVDSLDQSSKFVP